ncbi:MAG TPA: S-layer homology domain-containing protein [Thermoanaerobaculia bacterium]|nr:S-layer homology domain-containing protein [Thermoanaerobaculia bacterium]
MFAFAAAAPVLRGQDAASPSAAPRYGTKDQILAHVGYSDFRPIFSASAYAGSFSVYSTGGLPGTFHAVAHVPSGALVSYVELDYCDSNPSPALGVVLNLRSCTYNGQTCSLLEALSSKSGISGCFYVGADLTSKNYTMDNAAQELVLEAVTLAGDATTQLTGAYIGYKLQMSPAPATPTFGDVPADYPYFRAIEALVASGITGGCGNGNFCPNQNVTRGEMAAFLARALGLHFPN